MSWTDGDLLFISPAVSGGVWAEGRISGGSSLRGFAPQTPPRIYRSFLPEWMICVARYWGNRRTMEELDRRIGQRRDATRAPNQARSGWRPRSEEHTSEL